MMLWMMITIMMMMMLLFDVACLLLLLSVGVVDMVRPYWNDFNVELVCWSVFSNGPD